MPIRWLLLLIACSSVGVAADGPTKVLLEQGRLLGEVYHGEILDQLIPSGHRAFASARRFTVLKPHAVAHQQGFYLTCDRAFHRGDLVNWSAWVRAPQGPGRVSLCLKSSADLIHELAALSLDPVESTWRQLVGTVVLDRDYPASDLQIQVFLGGQAQVLDLGEVLMSKRGTTTSRGERRN